MSEKNNKIKNKNEFIIIILFLFNLLLPNILAGFSIDYSIFMQFFVSAFVVLVFLKTYMQEFKTSLQNFKNQLLKYIGVAFLSFVIYFVLNVIVNSIFSYGFNLVVPNNVSLDKLFRLSPIYFLISTIVISPILESCFIPLAFNKLFYKNKILYYFLCSLIYGIIYVIFSIKTPLQLLYITSYGISGFIIAYIYDKYKNICLPILFKIISALLFVATYFM